VAQGDEVGILRKLVNHGEQHTFTMYLGKALEEV
jgi:hypothetical protein